MENVKYIRHVFNEKRISSDTSEIFQQRPKVNTSYQDLVSFSNFEDGKYLVYTMGKHVFPQNLDVNASIERLKLIFIVEGYFKFGTQQLGSGDFVVLPSECSNIFTSGNENVIFYWCTTNDPMVIDTLLLCGYSENEMIFGHTDHLRSIVELFENNIYKFPQHSTHRIYLLGQFICLISFITSNVEKKKKESDQIFKQCLNLIDAKNGNITVDFLVKHCFVSQRYLYTLFKEYKNTTPTEYIMSVRMQCADRYLTSTNRSIAEIAELMGYSNYSHFARAYTKHFSISPSERRKQLETRNIIEKSDSAESSVSDQ